MSRFKYILIFLGISLPQFLIAAASPWLESARSDEKAYFLHAAPPRIEIYDMDAENWLGSIELEKAPTHFHVDDTFLYISYDKSIYRYDHDGANEAHIANFASNVQSIHSDGDILIVNQFQFDTFNRNTRAKIDSLTNNSYSFSGPSKHDPVLNRIIVAQYDTSIRVLIYQDDGTLPEFTSSYGTSHSNRIGNDLFIWPNSKQMIGETGRIYLNESLEVVENLASDIVDVAFVEETLPIVAAGKRVHAYSRGHQETGNVQLENDPLTIFVDDEADQVFAFFTDSSSDNGMGVSKIGFDELSVDDPSAPIDPSTLPFTPDSVFTDGNGILYLSHPGFNLLFRWDPETQAWLDSIELSPSANSIAYSPNNDKIYIGYESGEVTYIDPNAGTPSEIAFLDVEQPVGIVLPIGDYLLLDQYEGNNQNFHTYNSSGTELDSVSHGSRFIHTVWNEATSRITYTYTDSYDRIHAGIVESGGTLADYTSTQDLNNYSEIAPLYSHPTEGLVLASNGYLVRPNNQATETVLPDPIKGATWISGTLYTAHTGSLKKWNLPTYEENENSLSITSKPLSLQSTPDGKLILVSLMNSGYPRITVLTTDFEIIAPDTLNTPSLKLDKQVATAARLSWTPVNGAEEFLLERSTADTDSWSELVTLEPDTSSFTDIGFASGSSYKYRISAKNGDLVSGLSNTVTVSTNIDPNPLSPISPSKIQRTPYWARVGAANILYLAEEYNAAIFRYDLENQVWIDSIPLRAIPRAVHYSTARGSILVGYDDGMINEINLNGGPLNEQPLAKLNDGPYAITSNSNYFIATIHSNHFAFDSVGEEITSSYINSAEFRQPMLWDDESNAYYWSNYTLYSARLNESNELEQVDSTNLSYDNKLVAANFPQSLLLTSKGEIHSTSLSGAVSYLSENATTGTWLEGTLYTAYDDTVSRWTLPTYAEGLTYESDIEIHHLLADQTGRLVTISSIGNAAPQINILDTELNLVAPETLSPPSAPEFIFTYGDSVVFSWSDVGGDDGYIIDRKIGNGDWEEIAITDRNTTHYEDDEASAGTAYSYRIRATNGDTLSTYSGVLELSAEVTTPVTNLTSTINSENRIQLNWTPAEYGTQYKVERSTNGRYWYEETTLPLNSTTYVDRYSIDSNQLYFFRIVTEGAFSKKSISEYTTISVDLEEPPTSYRLNTDINGPYSVSLYWDETNNTTSYRIEKSLNKVPQEWSAVDTYDADTFQAIASGLEQDTKYIFRIISINDTGESTPKYSNSVRTEKLQLPVEPQLIVGQIDATSIQLNWSNPGYTDSFSLYRRKFLDKEWGLIAETDGNTLTHVDKNVSIDNGYAYYVEGTNGTGTSPRSGQPIITAQTQTQIFLDDFESGIDTSKYSEFTGDEASEPDNTFVRLDNYWGIISIENLNLVNGGIIAFSVRYTEKEQSSGATVNINLVGSGNYYSYYTVPNIDIEQMGISDEWRRFYINVPANSLGNDATLNFSFNGNYNTKPWDVDDIEIHQFPSSPPPSPLAVSATDTPDGEVAILWMPSLDADSYIVERSDDGENTWMEVARVNANRNFLHDLTVTDSEMVYRVSATNDGGTSSPTYSNETTARIELAEAIASGVSKVLESPTLYSLYTETEIEEAKITGHQEVQSNPYSFGLFHQETISHLYYQLESSIEMRGDLLSVAWVLYRSTDLFNWTEYNTDVTFEMELGETPQFIKLTPQIENK